MSRTINRIYLKIYGVTDFPIGFGGCRTTGMHIEAFKFSGPSKEIICVRLASRRSSILISNAIRRLINCHDNYVTRYILYTESRNPYSSHSHSYSHSHSRSFKSVVSRLISKFRGHFPLNFFLYKNVEAPISFSLKRIEDEVLLRMENKSVLFEQLQNFERTFRQQKLQSFLFNL